MVFKLAVVTVGQSPRDDVLPEIEDRVRGQMQITQFGVLDGLSDSEISDMAAVGDERRLCTRLRDGREVVTSKAKTGERLNGILNDLTGQDFDDVLLLCTGYFENVNCNRPYIESQRLVDGYVAAMSNGGRKIGIMVPVAEQMKEAKEHTDYDVSATAFASPYSDGNLRDAGAQLADMDIIVMHCMGYSQSMRQTVAQSSGRPVILARDVVAAGIDQLI